MKYLIIVYTLKTYKSNEWTKHLSLQNRPKFTYIEACKKYANFSNTESEQEEEIRDFSVDCWRSMALIRILDHAAATTARYAV